MVISNDLGKGAGATRPSAIGVIGFFPGAHLVVRVIEGEPIRAHREGGADSVVHELLNPVAVFSVASEHHKVAR